jgi:hypothetical protein
MPEPPEFVELAGSGSPHTESSVAVSVLIASSIETNSAGGVLVDVSMFGFA